MAAPMRSPIAAILSSPPARRIARRLPAGSTAASVTSPSVTTAPSGRPVRRSMTASRRAASWTTARPRCAANRTLPAGRPMVLRMHPLVSERTTTSRPRACSATSAIEVPSKTTLPPVMRYLGARVVDRPVGRVTREPAYCANRRPATWIPASTWLGTIASEPRSSTSITGSRAAHSAAGLPIVVGISTPSGSIGSACSSSRRPSGASRIRAPVRVATQT